MKKVWFVVSLIVLAMVMAACGSDSEEAGNETEAVTIDTEAEV